jgi:hypothetical protein
MSRAPWNQNPRNQNYPNAKTIALYLATVRTLLAASTHHSLQPADTAVAAAPFSPGRNNLSAQEDALALAPACYSSSSSFRE